MSKFTKEILLINSVSTVVSYFALIGYLVYFCDPSLRLVIIVSSLTIGLTTYSINWLYQITEEYVYITVRAFIVQVLSLIFMFLLIRSQDDYIWYAFIQVIGTSGSFIFNVIHARKYVNIFKRYDLNLKRHIKPVFTIFGIGLATSVYMSLDSVMLGLMVSTYAVGNYEASTKLAQVVKVVITSFSNVLIPRMSYYVASNKLNEFETLFKKCLEYIISFTIPMCIGMAILSEELILLACGQEYLQSVLAAQILAFNNVFSVIDGILYYQVMLPFKKEKQATLCTGIGAVLNLTLNIIFIPKFSFVGAAITTLISEFAVFIGLSYFSRNVITIKSIIMLLFKYLLFCIPIVIYIKIIQMLSRSFVLILALSIVGAIVIYAIILFVTKSPLYCAVFKRDNDLSQV